MQHLSHRRLHNRITLYTFAKCFSWYRFKVKNGLFVGRQAVQIFYTPDNFIQLKKDIASNITPISRVIILQSHL